MKSSKKWLAIFGAVTIILAIFGEKLVNFYFDWLWFETYGYDSVLFTTLSAQLGFGVLLGGIFFLFTFFILKVAYAKTSHLPVILSDTVRRDLPILDLIGSNLRILTIVVPLVLAGMAGMVGARNWELVLQYLNYESFGQVDPIFGKDYSFYLFEMPFFIFVKSVLWEILITVSIGIGAIYFFKRIFYATSNGFVFLPHARTAITYLAGAAFLLFAMNAYFARYELLFQSNSVVSGIGYADDHGRLPILNLSILIALLGAIGGFLKVYVKDLKKLFIAAGALGVVFVGGNLYPTVLQKFVVGPNELIKETPYIEHTIAATSLAFGLEKTEINELPGTSSLTASIIVKNKATIENIRLWDEDPLLDTLGQIQEIRTYYQFNGADNDRYKINGSYQQTLLSPRELNSSSLPNRNWINEHLTFTHGYGAALSPVNQITPEGLPVLFIQDIPPKSSIDIKIDQPEIYFGELSNDHVFVNTESKEFDYPAGEKNVYKNYAGTGGVKVGSLFRKALLAGRFQTMKILFSDDIVTESRVLMYRNITDRVRKVAPFLELDRDPYLVISEGKLVWMYDAYTVSSRFPYSQTVRNLGNYVRNSVKIVVDAYNGTMDFYISDPKDPIILTYKNVFPDLFKSLTDMPSDLKSHIRYPKDLFAVQTLVYTTYHMKTPQVFYNKEDQWEIPEIDNKAMQPYYTIMTLPGREEEEYILMLPFTPRGKSNLSAWMVARSDGEHYGKLGVYTFPKQRLVYGPNQIVARINQDAEVSRQISLWDQRGSSVIQGNLLVIPIEESLIYVRPLYLKADAGKIPELKRVIVGYEDQIAMEQTLDMALQKLFSGLPANNSQSRSIAKLEKKLNDNNEPMLLKRSDYLAIKDYFSKALASQKKIETSLKTYSKDLEAISKVLESVETVKSEVQKGEDEESVLTE
jgi:uncharacterized membrane protein (UPF0182 family)